MAWVRVDTQTILTIDDVVITRSQRISVRHMTDASIDHPPRHNHHQKNNNNNSKSLLASASSHAPMETIAPGGRRPTSIHKTWQLIIRDVQSSDAGLYVRYFVLSYTIQSIIQFF